MSRRSALLTKPSGKIIVPVFANAAAHSVASSVPTATPAVPAPLAGTTGEGDVLVCLCWANNTSATWPSVVGWADGAAAPTIGCKNFTRVADGTESGTFSFTRATSLTGAAGAIVVRIPKGVFAVSNVNTAAAGLTIALATIAAAAHRSLLVQIVTNVTTSAGTFTAPGDGSGTTGNPTKVIDTTSAGQAVEFAVGVEVVDFGPTGGRTWSKTLSQQARGSMFVLSPAA